jgi:hypothetical protein
MYIFFKKPVPSLPPATTAREVHPTRDLCAVSAAGKKRGGGRRKSVACVVKCMSESNSK